MASWSDLRAAAPHLASEGERLFHRGDVDEALLATVRDDEPPRVHPIWVRVVDGRLYAFIGRSPKRTDLERDGRYALHAHQDPKVPYEFSVRGRVRRVDDPGERDRIAGSWYFAAGDEYVLFEFGVDMALLGVRESQDEWPPRYTSWSASGRPSERTAAGR